MYLKGKARNHLFWPILSTTFYDLKVTFGIGESAENFMSKYMQEV